MKNFFVNNLVAIALVATSAACDTPDAPGSVGTAAPAYAARSATSHDSVSLASLHGSVVLLNVWATWCIPCRREVPELEALSQQYAARGLRVVGVSVDEAGADADVVDFMNNFGMRYIILRDPQDNISDLFRIPGVPASFLIDRAGIVRWRKLGALRVDEKDFAKQLQKTLESKEPHHD